MVHWSEEEEELLEEKYYNHTEDELEELLDRSGEAIRRKAQRISVEKCDNYLRLKSIVSSDWIDLDDVDDDFGYFIAGFVAGEGSFPVSNQSGRSRDKYTFQIVLADDDSDILYEVKETLGCGNITHQPARRETEKAQVHFRVDRFGDLYKRIIPFFNEYGFYCSRKQRQFDEWSESVEDQIPTERFK